MNTHTVHDVCAVFSDTAEEFAEVTEKNNLVQFNATSCRVEVVGPAGGVETTASSLFALLRSDMFLASLSLV